MTRIPTSQNHNQHDDYHGGWTKFACTYDGVVVVVVVVVVMMGTVEAERKEDDAAARKKREIRPFMSNSNETERGEKEKRNTTETRRRIE